MPKKTITVLLVDDHEIVRQGLYSLLSLAPDFEVLGDAAGGQEAVNLSACLKPDLVIMDLLMPDMSGVEAIREILKVSPTSTISVLTSSEDEDLAFEAIEAGAQSYLLKSMLGDELLSHLRSIAKGEKIIHPFVVQQIIKRARTFKNSEPNPFDELTERELEVLRALAEGASNIRIASNLGISEKTVKSHISSVFSKLQLANRSEAVAFAWREGLLKR